MLNNYEKYLSSIDKSLEGFFTRQAPYIFCKVGCAKCCEIGEFPFTRLEFEYAMMGFNSLPENTKKTIKEKAKKIIEDKTFSKDKVFMHECPFLIGKKCSIYKYRGLVCRSHGLLYYEKDSENNTKFRIPNCVNHKLNYSKVYAPETKSISSTKWKETGIEVEPEAFNIGRDLLTENNLTQELKLDFGEDKALIDWFKIIL